MHWVSTRVHLLNWGTPITLSQLQCGRSRRVSHHLGLVPHVLLAVDHRSADGRSLDILTPVGGSTSTLLHPEQGGGDRWRAEGDNKLETHAGFSVYRRGTRWDKTLLSRRQGVGFYVDKLRIMSRACISGYVTPGETSTECMMCK